MKIFFFWKDDVFKACHKSVGAVDSQNNRDTSTPALLQPAQMISLRKVFSFPRTSGDFLPKFERIPKKKKRKKKVHMNMHPTVPSAVRQQMDPLLRGETEQALINYPCAKNERGF